MRSPRVRGGAGERFGVRTGEWVGLGLRLGLRAVGAATPESGAEMLRRRVRGAVARLAAGAGPGALARGAPMLGRTEGQALQGQVRHAGNLKLVADRMKSVKNVQKITKAMKVVAAAKLRQVQVKCETSRGFWQPTSFFIAGEKLDPGVGSERQLTLAITSDKGLCGGVNSQIVKNVRALAAMVAQENPEVKEQKVITIGLKAEGMLKKVSPGFQGRDDLVMSISEHAKMPPTYATAAQLADLVLQSKDFDVLRIVYNRFKSAIQFVPTVATVHSVETLQASGVLDAYEWEGSSEDEMMMDLQEFNVAAQMYNALLENTTSEMGARMMAMDNSTNNATDMLNKLTLVYNRGRQAAITTELIEIISGASALEDKSG